ncbi:Tripeptidyl-peptidase sed2 [Lachnellula suecica]|uniref:tripeptidyl-peptidase II n=1 Tax=Lachnellula suecica TaxID=602035 RepID=A0A8T9C276_9HELO|nr:Tripeptidyl-peptidase sed2 [Lachnellula suecica]
MRSFNSLISLLILELIPSVVSTPVQDPTSHSWGSYQIAEATKYVPFGWTYEGPARNDSILNLQLVVKAGSGQDLTRQLMKISTPGDADYGKHLSQKQLLEFVSPEAGSVDFVTSWLSSFSGVGGITYLPETNSLSFQSTVEAATLMLQTEFGIYSPKTGTGEIIRSLQYSLPEAIRRNIALVHPITYFPKPTSLKLKTHTKVELRETSITPRDVDPALLAACGTITPTCIAKLYNIDYTPPVNGTPSGSMLGVAGFLEQYINHTDVNSFVRKYGNSAETRANPGSFSVELVNNGTNEEDHAGIEATLDMEYSMPFTGSLPVVYYSTGGRPPSLDETGNEKPLNESYNEPYLEWLQYMLAKPDGEIPQVISISYTDTEQTVPRDYAVHVCDLFGRLASRGVSIIDASGDGGVAGQEDVDCISNDGQNRKTFLPTFPASCPWVTAVGSTSVIPEQGSDFSSGGFSNYFAVPDYQRNATAAYIATLDGQYQGLYNASGRGIPDIAVFGSRYETENGNMSSGHHSGTSAGTPVFASMIALINDMRLRAGKPVLGWLNPLLYSQAMEGVLNDITVGNSYGCEEVWNATAGWDAVTGLGTPDFKRLAAMVG